MNHLLKISALWFAISVLVETLSPISLVAQENLEHTNLKFRTVALTRTPVVGLGEGVTFSNGGWPDGFGNVSVDANGRTAFQAGLKAKGLVDSYSLSSTNEFANDEAFFLETGSGIEPLLRKGDAVLQDKPNLKLTYVQSCYSGDGNVLALARLSDKPRGGETSHAVFTNFGGEFRAILKTGDPAIGTEGTFSVFYGIQSDVNFAKGILTFRSAVFEVPDAKRNPVGLWTGKPDAIKLLAKTGQPAIGMEPDTKFTGFSDFKQNASGQVIFSASYKGTKSGTSSTGIWLANSGESPKLILKTGDSLSGLPEGATLDRISMSDLNDAGQIAAYANFKADGSKQNGVVIFADESGARAAMQTGQKIEGASEPVGGFKSFKISPAGMLAVQYLWRPAKEKGGFKQGLVLVDPQKPDSPELIAKSKAKAPGVTEGVAFGPFGPQFFFLDDERVVFSTTGSDRKSYTFTSNRGGEPDLIAHPGMEIEVQPGENKKVKTVGLWRGTRITDSASVAAYLPFVIRFEDRTRGLLVAEVPSK